MVFSNLLLSSCTLSHFMAIVKQPNSTLRQTHNTTVLSIATDSPLHAPPSISPKRRRCLHHTPTFGAIRQMFFLSCKMRRPTCFFTSSWLKCRPKGSSFVWIDFGFSFSFKKKEKEKKNNWRERFGLCGMYTLRNLETKSKP
jgi:hypothetical protein